MMQNIFTISLSMSAVILLLVIITPLLSRRYTTKWRYFVWLIVALRLIIPIKLELTHAPVSITVPNHTIVFRQGSAPVAIIDDSYIEKGNASPSSADSAPIITLQGLLAAIWVLGAMSFFLYHIISYITFKRKIKPYCSKIDTEVLGNVLSDIKVRVKPQLLECSKIASPMMCGDPNKLDFIS